LRQAVGAVSVAGQRLISNEKPRRIRAGLW
jgi:hypothetical protein